MKAILKASILLAGIALYSCGGNSSNNENENKEEPVSNADNSGGGDMMNNAPSTGIDIYAKSDSKGVGKFTDVKTGKLDPDMAAKGEQLFQSKCSVCHKPTDEKLIGPGLKGITTIRTPEWILNMITNPSGMTQKDPVAMALLDEFKTQMTFQGVSDEEARDILEYLRKNDGVQ